jgi:hypothetical protein
LANLHPLSELTSENSPLAGILKPPRLWTLWATRPPGLTSNTVALLQQPGTANPVHRTGCNGFLDIGVRSRWRYHYEVAKQGRQRLATCAECVPH